MDKKNKTILIIDDDADFAQSVSEILEYNGYTTLIRTNPVEALRHFQSEHVDLVLLDIIMPEMDGREVLSQLTQIRPEVPVIMITGQAYDVPVAIEASKKGSFSFLPKGVKLDIKLLMETVRKALNQQVEVAISPRVEAVMKELGMVTQSPKMLTIMANIERASNADIAVMITGESGVGKELLARAIHKLSRRWDKQFVAVDCGTLSESLSESELFGYVKGAFTGANTDKVGYFESADGGTIFLDEIANTSLTFQQKLLTVLQSESIRRVGDTREIHVDVRIITATNKKPEELLRSEQFRADLFYRLCKVDIEVPPLRDRPEDLPLLAKYLLTKACRIHELPEHYFSPAAIDMMRKHEWKGNIRELDNIVTKLAIFTESTEIDHPAVIHALKVQTRGVLKDQRPLMEQVEDFEKMLILEALRANDWNRTKAAEQLGVERTNLIKKINKHGIRNEKES